MTERGCWVYAVTDRDLTDDLSEIAEAAGTPYRPTEPRSGAAAARTEDAGTGFGLPGARSGPAEPLTGVAGTTVRPARAAGLTALVSDVDLAEFGAEALRRNLEDIDWLERTARAHHEVIGAATRRVPLLPMRLATVYQSRDTLADTLRTRRADFLDALAQVGGREEWGVKAYAQPGGAGEAREVIETGEAGEGVPAKESGSGMAYLKKRRAQLTARQDERRDATAGARQVHAGLAYQAVRARLHPPQSPRLSGERAPMLLNAAYLLSPSDGTRFAQAVAAADAAHPELRVELTGPWPPYSFAGEDAAPAPDGTAVADEDTMVADEDTAVADEDTVVARKDTR